MDCYDFEEEMLKYPEVSSDFYKHLESCSRCQRLWRDWIAIENKISENKFGDEWEIVFPIVLKRLRREQNKRRLIIAILSSIYLLMIFLLLYLIINIPALSLIFYGIILIIQNLYLQLFLISIILTIFVAFYTEIKFQRKN
ncbi:MAG: hypothetical protein CBR30_04860 [Dictyoglomus sp. NZ13-RE01]|nr:MAG: hypothetical protein CBR30_04860 [Dictyoglomus sp. NZ13-RE01]